MNSLEVAIALLLSMWQEYYSLYSIPEQIKADSIQKYELRYRGAEENERIVLVQSQ